MADPSSYIFFLRGSHLFPGLNDEKLWQIAEQMDEVTFEAGNVIFNEKEKGDAFYIIARGKVEISHKVGKKVERLATLVKGDYFGENALLSRNVRNATARAETDVTLLRLTREDFLGLIKTVPKLDLIFKIVTKTRRLSRQMKFDWKGDDEIIYFISKKHAYDLILKMAPPAFIFFAALMMFLAGAFMESSAIGDILWWVAIPALVFSVLYGIWQYVDWDNDYYVITNQRVVEVQKVVFLHDSRKEAPLSTVLSIGVETQWLGRWLDFGDVVVNTFTGKIKMTDVDYPRQVASMVDEFWRRVKQQSNEEQLEGLKKSIKTRINPPPPKKPDLAGAPTAAQQKAASRLAAAKWFSLRDEDGNTIIYHKHWFVFFRNAWYRIGLLLLSLTALISWLIYFPAVISVAILISIVVVFAIGWVIWAYIDWQNDLYMVTDDQILDIYKEPLGKEDRRSALLINILSVEFTRDNIINSIFNYGTVKISIGGGQFDFKDVANPPQVQSDIIHRMNKAIARKKEADAASEKNRMLDWISMYHNTIEDMRKAQGNTNPNESE